MKKRKKNFKSSKNSLNKLRGDFEKYYSVTDEKFKKDDFEKNVLKENTYLKIQLS